MYMYVLFIMKLNKTTEPAIVYSILVALYDQQHLTVCINDLDQSQISFFNMEFTNFHFVFHTFLIGQSTI